MFEQIVLSRKSYTSNPELQEDYDRLSKVAYVMDLADATEALYLMDEQAGLINRYNKNLPDPVLSVYGLEKEASWSWNHGGDHCSHAQLLALTKTPLKRHQLQSLFSQDIIDKLEKTPVSTFEKMPLEQQIIISRVASSSDLGVV